MNKELDTLEEIYEVKREITSSFSSYDDFAAWLLKEQAAAKARGIVFVAA